MKATLWRWLMESAGVFLLLPFLTVQLVSSHGGMAAGMLLLLGVDPIWAAVTGVTAGRQPQSLWFLPLVLDGLFALGFWFLLGTDLSALLFYVVLYTGLSYGAMGLTALLKRTKRS